MTETIIHKILSKETPPNLLDYSQCYADFRWSEQDRSSPKKLNIAYEAVDRHLNTPIENKLALRWLGKDNQCLDFTYRELAEQSSRFASVLAKLGMGQGARIFSLLGRVPELYITALGTLKAGCVFTPLFSAFGPEPIRTRMVVGEVSVIVTTQRLYQKNLAPWWREWKRERKNELKNLKAILLIDASGELESGCYALADLMTDADPLFPCAHTGPQDMALLHFTSGTTGKPKGVVHAHQSVELHKTSARYALDLNPSDIYWCTADPGWVTGISYGIIGPLCIGVTVIVDEAEFDTQRWYQLLEQQKVTVWYTAPTAIRMLMKAEPAIRDQYDLSALRFIASVGEPLNPEAVIWGQQVLGLPIHDNWWQTETGGIMIANFASQPIKPGSMGLPLPGITAAIMSKDEHEQIKELEQPNQVGELVLKQGWPSMFRGYLNQPVKFHRCFKKDWYLTGDLAMRDEDGYFWFVGRSDDLIKSAGHLIGPFEVESALMEHDAVAEVGVIGIPDLLTGESVKAFVTLKSGSDPTEELQKELQGFARKRLGAAIAPKSIDFRENLPKTRSGKIMRRLLKARELGLPEGDISTLESDEQ